MKVKTCAAQIKAAGTHEGTADGVFDALVATYDLDSVGDKITPGAFADTLASWHKSGDPIPVYWSHRMDDPNMNIGSVIEAKETEQGLQVKAQLDLDNPTAAQVYKLLKGRRVTQFSFAYDVEDGSFVEPKDAAPFYELRKLSLYEVGPTPIGANQATELIDVKTAQRNVTVEVRNANPAETGAITRAVKRALRHPGRKAPLAPAEPTETPGGTDPDEDPVALISAAEASLDEAVELFAGVDLTSLPADAQQAIALVNGAELLIDTAMELLGIADPDDEAEIGPKQHTHVRSKEGRRNAANDMKTLQGIHDATLQLGADCSASASNDPNADDGKSQQGATQATPTTTATTEEPDGAKIDAPAWDGAASIRLRTQLALMNVELS